MDAQQPGSRRCGVLGRAVADALMAGFEFPGGGLTSPLSPAHGGGGGLGQLLSSPMMKMSTSPAAPQLGGWPYNRCN